MNFKIFKNEREPAMLYEAIACHAFDCGRMQDPGAIADASFFDANFVPPLTQEGLNGIYSVIDELIKKENNSDKIEEYYSIRNSLEIGMDQENSIQLLGLLADMIND